jgi:hypothetical protein
LRQLLRDPARAPVLVLATLWPEFWDRLTARPAGAGDPHAHARELLAGRDITVPAAFTPAQLPLLTAAGDPRLVLAAGAEDGRVVQFLAGAPELVARYRNAPAAAAALVDAAMDARRLGMGIALPLAFLEEAAPGYLADSDWDALPEDWLEEALARRRQRAGYRARYPPELGAMTAKAEPTAAAGQWLDGYQAVPGPGGVHPRLALAPHRRASHHRVLVGPVMAVRPGARLGRGPDVEEPGAAGLGQLVQGNRHRVRGHRGPGRGGHRALAGRGGRLSLCAHRND